VFFGKINDIDDSVTIEGGTVKELKRSFHEAVDDYLETCKHRPGFPLSSINIF